MSGSRGRGGGKGSNRGRPPAKGSPKPSARAQQKRTGAAKDGGSGKQPSGPPRVGRRPSSPTFLLAVAVAWLAASVFAFFGLHAGWKLIPTICFAGVGLLYLRGAAGAYLRRPGPSASGKK